ncbi:MAG: helix-turn-helix protein [Bacteroidetes bacterium]|jgi:AraC-like DNA-binding protein|nr:helix-turn-helix protein [Bacteroidota bacterium]
MILRFSENTTTSEIVLVLNETKFDRMPYTRDKGISFYTLLWNDGPTQKVIIDEVEYTFPANGLLPLMSQQSFRFEDPAKIIGWQFNADFYCILNHDKEVSCIGFLFYGSGQMLFLNTSESDQQKLRLLLKVFIDEFDTVDNSQHEMLRMLLKRLIILTTRLAKSQHLEKSLHDLEKYDIVRKYNYLVEENFRKEHSVQFYAKELNRSPKTLANLFAIYNHKSPLRVIHERLLMESKRLLHYTDKSTKEIAYELGFDDSAHFSNFFKKNTTLTPSEYRLNQPVKQNGK